MPAVTRGSDENLEELMEVVTFGFPFGTALAPGRRELMQSASKRRHGEQT
jgi:hypothetical protein